MSSLEKLSYVAMIFFLSGMWDVEGKSAVDRSIKKLLPFSCERKHHQVKDDLFRFKRLVIASDHAGFALKQKLVAWAKKQHLVCQDLGPVTQDAVDYPDYARRVVAEVYAGQTCGVLICGSGIGMSIAANRYPGIRAVLCHESSKAKLARRHNDANIIVFGGRDIEEEVAFSCLLNFLTTSFDGGRHGRRLRKIERSTMREEGRSYAS